MDFKSIINFWFSETTKPLWFNSTNDFDTHLKKEYLAVYNDAKELKLKTWQIEPLGALALVIILDQFPLNMFREMAESFVTEALARDIAAKAIEQGFDAEFTAEQKIFLYMPYMHSEDLTDQEQSLILFNQEGLEYNLEFAQRHYNIVKQFGRFPHRNKILGRENSDPEIEYLNSDKTYKG